MTPRLTLYGPNREWNIMHFEVEYYNYYNNILIWPIPLFVNKLFCYLFLTQYHRFVKQIGLTKTKISKNLITCMQVSREHNKYYDGRDGWIYL